MAEVDVGLFDFDFDTTFALFILNQDKNIYLRYGARTDAGADAQLSDQGLLAALTRGLALHREWQAGDLPLPPPPKPIPVQSFPKLRKIVEKGSCVHCHQISGAKAEAMIAREDFNKKTMPWVYPDPAKLGLEIDPDDGIRLKTSHGAAAAAGLKANDQLRQVNQQTVHTFADVQHALHQLPLDQQTLTIRTDRKTHQLTLPEFWRVTDINRRGIGHSIRPFPEFWGKTLPAEEKEQLGLNPDGFATRLTKFWGNTNGKRAGLRQGDLVIAVDGVTASPLAQNAMIYIRTHFETGDEIRVRYLRQGKEATTNFRLRAKPW